MSFTPRFVFDTDGTAINVAHIVTIYIHPASTKAGQAEGYVVRCRTILSDAQYVAQDAVLSLSPTLPSREAAQTFIDAIVKGLLNPPDEASA